MGWYLFGELQGIRHKHEKERTSYEAEVKAERDHKKVSFLFLLFFLVLLSSVSPFFLPASSSSSLYLIQELTFDLMQLLTSQINQLIKSENNMKLTVSALQDRLERILCYPPLFLLLLLLFFFLSFFYSLSSFDVATEAERDVSAAKEEASKEGNKLKEIITLYPKKKKFLIMKDSKATIENLLSIIQSLKVFLPFSQKERRERLKWRGETDQRDDVKLTCFSLSFSSF